MGSKVSGSMDVPGLLGLSGVVLGCKVLLTVVNFLGWGTVSGVPLYSIFLCNDAAWSMFLCGGAGSSSLVYFEGA